MSCMGYTKAQEVDKCAEVAVAGGLRCCYPARPMKAIRDALTPAPASLGFLLSLVTVASSVFIPPTQYAISEEDPRRKEGDVWNHPQRGQAGCQGGTHCTVPLNGHQLGEPDHLGGAVMFVHVVALYRIHYRAMRVAKLSPFGNVHYDGNDGELYPEV